MSEKLVVRLTAEKGRSYDEDGQAIASYEKRRSLVFMPRGAEPGREYRVQLEEIQPDKRGVMMYQAEPAPVDYSERWKDNGDGTASKLTIQTDWLGNETVWDEAEPKKLETREGQPSIFADREVVWGSNHTSSYVEEIEIRTIPIESEVVKNGTLVWEKTSEREKRGQPTKEPILEATGTVEEWRNQRFETTYQPDWKVSLGIVFHLRDRESRMTVYATWGELPTWFQVEVQVQYPVCSCGRQRRDEQVVDGYGKCELCRAEETCERCGKQAKVAVINSRLVCEDCQPYEEQEQLIAAHLTGAHRQTIAEEAKKLIAGQALAKEEGEAVLRATVGHITNSWTRDQILRKWCSHNWYYFCEEGVFGSQLSPAAISLLGYLPVAAGNGLVEMVAWLTWVKDRGPSGGRLNFYLYTQLENQKIAPYIAEDDLKELVDKLEAGQPVLADRLRGSEADRIAALEAFRQAEELADAPYGSRIYKPYSEARQALEGEEQDYDAALRALEEVFAEKARQKVLEDLLVREYSTCPICGDEWNFHDEGAHYCSEGQETLRTSGQYQNFEVKVSRVGGTELVKLIAAYDDYHSDYELRLEINEEGFPEISDTEEVETKNYWRKPSERERELAEKLETARVELAHLESELGEVGRFGRVLVTLREGVDPQGQPQLQVRGRFTGSVENRKAGTRYSEYTDTEVLFVKRYHCDWLDEEPQAGQTWVATVAFQIGMTQGIPIIVVNPQVCVGRKSEIEAEVVQLEAELMAERERKSDLVEEVFDGDNEPQTAMAAAFAEAVANAK